MDLRAPEKAAHACLQMGDSYKKAKKYQESLYYYKLALNVSPLTGSVKTIAFNSIAEVYVDLYQDDLALHYYSKAIDQARMTKDQSTQELTLIGLADLYYQQGQRDKAVASIRQARQLNRQQGNDLAEAALRHLAGQIDQEEGLREQALENFEQALAIYQRTDNREGQIKVLCSISRLYLSSAQKQLALGSAEQALDLAEKQAQRTVTNADLLRATELRWRAWLTCARAQRATGQNEVARKSFLHTIGHIEGLWWLAYIATENSAVRFREELQAIYREFVDLLIEQGQFKQAYEWAERAKARATMGLIEARRMTKLPKKADLEGTLRELSRDVARLRTHFLSPQTSAEQRAKIQKQMREAEYSREEALLRAEMERFRDRLVWSQPATIKLLQEKMIQEKDTMVEFFLGEDRSFVWLITTNDISLEILPGRKEIEKTVKQYLEMASSMPSNIHIERDLSRLRKLAETLFSKLFGRLSKQIAPGQKLIIVPDGLLHYLPFEALIHDGRYLVEDHEVGCVPSASMLRLWQDSKDTTVTEDRMELLAFADPIFGPELKTSGSRQSRNSPNHITQQMRASRGFQLAQLPRTHDEVEYIASLFSPERRQVYLGKGSTEDAVKKEPLSRYRRLHFATHSLVNEESPSRSAVVLTLDSNTDEDGFLEVSEISELDLDCDLVVLSACQTGHGQLLSGEGIVGLSRAFLYAGARSVVVSLWNVSDISTAQLMKSFYQHLAGNFSNAAALREAKLRMLQSSTETRHPYYWAPFILIGKP
jgi:CHAT domain-containing protein/predicted negative regulator of RcsB-dependent stress response